MFKKRIRQITHRTSGSSLPEMVEELKCYMQGWKAYFKLAQTPGIFKKLEAWLRYRLRTLQLKHWRRGTTVYRELRKCEQVQYRQPRLRLMFVAGDI